MKCVYIICCKNFAFNLQVDKENLLFGVLPRVYFEDKSTYTESHTKEYDMVRKHIVSQKRV